MDFLGLIKSRRSVRFFEQEAIAREDLLELIEAARCAPSAANRQPLEYIIVDEAAVVEKVFEQLAWAAAVQPRRNPPAGSRPVAHIVVLVNEEVALPGYGKVDAAAAIENILLAAHAKGIGSCWLGSVNRDKVRGMLGIGEKMAIDSVVALGRPAEEPVMEDARGGEVTYYLDGENRLHVPKRVMDNIVHLNKYRI